MIESKIEYLIDELGRIEDRFVDEAMTYEKPARKGHRVSKSLVLIAAVVMMLVLSLTIIADLGDKKSKPQNDYDSENVPSYTSNDRLYTNLLAIDVQSLGAIRVESDVSELLYGKTPRLIWTFGDGVYYSVTLRNSADKEIIDGYLKNDVSIKADPNDEFSDFRFWIAYGDGKCTTPYLENNGGRDSYGALSDYLPEIYPSDAFARFIGSLISEQL